MSNVNIVPAKSEDAAEILSFIKELAEYEKLSDQVTATVESLRENIFVKREAEVVFAEVDGVKLGFALYFHKFSTFLGKPTLYLEDLFVKPEARGKGLGKKLLCYLAKLTVDSGFGRLDWQVLDWNKPSIAFYDSIGARPQSDWITYRLQGEALRKMGRQF
jgi:GNAT superfamily N-acetyltransferase